MRKVLGCEQRDDHDRRRNPPDVPTPAARSAFAPADNVFHRRTAQPTPILYDDNPGGVTAANAAATGGGHAS
jgi:hypothetical protein